MTEQQRQVAQYIARHPVLGWYAVPPPSMAQHVLPPLFYQRLPTAEQLAGELLTDSEFQALKLGSWLGTTEGEVVAEAVSLVIPPAYGPAFTLAVDALTIAARRQSEQGRQTAEGIGLVGSLVLLVCFILA